jgi:hypothetical protein
VLQSGSTTTTGLGVGVGAGLGGVVLLDGLVLFFVYPSSPKLKAEVPPIRIVSSKIKSFLLDFLI